MALRVWLPLNGTLENKGASDDITYAMSSGNSFTSGGKISNNALKLTKVQQILGTTSCMTGAKEVSYAFWVKVNTAWSTNWLDGIKWISTDGTSTATERQEFYDNCTHVGTWYRGGAIYAGEFTPEVWTHLAATINYNTGEACFYVNGDLKGTTSNVDTTYYCRGDFYIGDNGVDILQNDVRIYDHCLSTKEVKEISQGLILHYKLDGWSGGAGENLVWNSNWNKNSTSPPESWTNWGSPPTREIVQINNKYWLHVISNTTQFQGYSQNWTKRVGFGEISAGEILTVSFTAYLASAASIAPIGIHWCNTSSTIVSQVWTTTSLTATPTRYSFTYTTPANCAGFNIMVGDNTNTAHEIWITDIKVERGSVATPWSPAPEDLGIDITKITDSSGYEHDGIATNAPIAVEDSARYNICTQFNGSNQYIRNDLQMKNNYPTDEITVSWWGYMTSWGSYGRAISCTEGGGWNFEPANGYMRWAVGTGTSSNTYITTCTSTTSLSSLSSCWHHFVGTYDGFNVKLYIDGTLEKDIAAYTTKTPLFYANVYLYIGCEASATTPYFNGKLSDIRIYATALSAEDISDLYHTSANIDDLGNLHGFEFVSAGENLVYNANIAISGALDRNANGVRLYSQTNCISSFEDNYIRIYRPPNINHDSSTMHNMWGGLRLRNSSVGSIHVYNSSTDNIFNLQKGHTYVMYFTVKGKSTNAATSIGWTNDMGWGGGGLLPTPSNVEYLYTPVNFNGEMDCFYKFTISDDIVKTCTNSYGNFVAGNQYMSYCDFMYGFGYENTGSLGTDVKVNNLRLYDITSTSNSDITLSGIVNSLSFVEDDYTTAKIRRYGEILENLIIEK